MPTLGRKYRGLWHLVDRRIVKDSGGDVLADDKGVKQLYNSPRNWVLRSDASVEALCPGTKAVTA